MSRKKYKCKYILQHHLWPHVKFWTTGYKTCLFVMTSYSLFLENFSSFLCKITPLSVRHDVHYTFVTKIMPFLSEKLIFSWNFFLHKNRQKLVFFVTTRSKFYISRIIFGWLGDWVGQKLRFFGHFLIFLQVMTYLCSVFIIIACCDVIAVSFHQFFFFAIWHWEKCEMWNFRPGQTKEASWPPKINLHL